MDGGTIYLKPNDEVRDKNVLLIDDVTTTGSTMRRCAEALLECHPRTIYGLTFCKSMQ